jgi:cellulose synthase/poly-beta-1,6-N-acetylglucosamine synthase-like glycosyltransferase
MADLSMMRLLFWLSALAVGYVYVGYPALLVIWASLRPARTRRVPPARAEAPRVSVVMAVRNEAARLAARIDNLRALEYPVDRLEIIVVDDGSTDDTLDVLFQHRDVLHAVASPALGKASALNLGAARATGDVLVFADARQMFSPDALRALVEPLADPSVGGVTGELILDCEAADVPGRRVSIRRGPEPSDRRACGRGPDRRRGERRGSQASTIGEGVGLYWRYEKQLRRLESTVGSTLGATGAIYALRRSLYRPLPVDTILDDVLTPMRAVLAGYRMVFNERAVAFDRVAVDAQAERRRKIRTLAGNFQILRQEPRLLVPIVNPVWLQYVSHKLGRLFVPYALFVLFASNAALASGSVFYSLTLAAQGVVYLLAAYGAWLDSRRSFRARGRAHGWVPVDRLARVALTFMVMNYSAVAGLVSALTRRHVWR